MISTGNTDHLTVGMGEFALRFAKPGEYSCVNAGQFTVHSQQACTNIIIMGVDGEVGRLTWDDGQFAFNGDMAESAQIFFDNFLKPLVDSYIESERAAFECIDCPL